MSKLKWYAAKVMYTSYFVLILVFLVECGLWFLVKLEIKKFKVVKFEIKKFYTTNSTRFILQILNLSAGFTLISYDFQLTDFSQALSGVTAFHSFSVLNRQLCSF